MNCNELIDVCVLSLSRKRTSRSTHTRMRARSMAPLGCKHHVTSACYEFSFTLNVSKSLPPFLPFLFHCKTAKVAAKRPLTRGARGTERSLAADQRHDGRRRADSCEPQSSTASSLRGSLRCQSEAGFQVEFG